MNRTKNETETEIGIEVFPEFLVNGNDDHCDVIIKHDYYATDDDHGRSLLNSYLKAIAGKNQSIAFYITGSGAKILDAVFMDLNSGKDIRIFICSSSLKIYSPELPDGLSAVVLDDEEFFSELLMIRDAVIIE